MISLYFQQPDDEELAQHYAQSFGFEIKPYDGDLIDETYLYLREHRLELRLKDKPKEIICIDFLSGKTAHRFQFGGGQGQQIAKAVGISSYKPNVLDLTAGFAQDAFVLVSLGCRVIACEQNPVIAALVLNALERAKAGCMSPDLEQTLERLDYQFISAQSYLAKLTTKPDVMYLDPMFDEGSYAKSQVKKEANALRLLAAAPADADELLERALECARCRVVVKRPKQGRVLANIQPSYQLKGKSNRYDIYALKQVKP